MRFRKSSGCRVNVKSPKQADIRESPETFSVVARLSIIVGLRIFKPGSDGDTKERYESETRSGYKFGPETGGYSCHQNLRLAFDLADAKTFLRLPAFAPHCPGHACAEWEITRGLRMAKNTPRVSCLHTIIDSSQQRVSEREAHAPKFSVPAPRLLCNV